MAVGEAHLEGGADPGVEVDFDFVIGVFGAAVEAVVGLDVALPEGGEAEEEMGQQGDPPVGKGGEE